MTMILVLVVSDHIDHQNANSIFKTEVSHLFRCESWEYLNDERRVQKTSSRQTNDIVRRFLRVEES